jgi:ribonuclease P protein subunit RPR2
MTRIVLLLLLLLLSVPDGLPRGPYIDSCFLSGAGARAHTDNKKQQTRELARERIEILVAVALKEQDSALARRQANLAKKIAMRHRVRMPYGIRQLYCKKCKAFIVPGREARVRVGRSAGTKAVRITCTLCGHTYHKILKQNKDL